MKENQFHNPMRENAYDVPNLLRTQCVEIEKNSRMVITTPDIYNFRRIVIIGCGDSYAAGLSIP